MTSSSRDHSYSWGMTQEELRMERFEEAKSQIHKIGDAIPKYSLRSPTSNDRKSPVFMVWDHENIRPPANCSKLIDNIERGIRTCGRDYYLCGGVGFGSLSHFDSNQYGDITENFPISLINIPRANIRCGSTSCNLGTPYKRETDQADDALIQHMLFYANDIKPPGTSFKPTFLVISDDADFVTATQSLLVRNYDVFGCVSRPTTAKGFNPLVVKELKTVWYWDQLSDGKGTTPSTKILEDLEKVNQGR